MPTSSRLHPGSWAHRPLHTPLLLSRPLPAFFPPLLTARREAFQRCCETTASHLTTRLPTAFSS